MRRFGQFPVDGQRRVIPEDATLGARLVVVGGLVEEFCVVAQHHETMGEAFRHPQLAVVLCRQAHADPLTEVRRAATNVDGYVEYFAGNDTHQFALGMFKLIVQTPQHAFLRA